MMDEEKIKQKFRFLGEELSTKIMDNSIIRTFPENTEILKEGQYVSAVPIVLDGLLKVFTRGDDRELLLYYIQPFESCVMSFSAGINQEASRIVAITEEKTTLLLLPVQLVQELVNQYPKFNMLFHKQYELRYQELLETVNQLVFSTLEQRLIEYLTEKKQLTGKYPVKLSHREMAGELGTAREVISRIIKKLENAGSVRQGENGLEIL